MIRVFFKTHYGYLRAIIRRDPFQTFGVPCWKGCAGPLEPVGPYSGGFSDNE